MITENQRVLAGRRLLRGGQFGGVGRLLNASHASLRDDFEISWPEADVRWKPPSAPGRWGPG